MIICALPRCGATKICLDLEERKGLKFIGEPHPMYINTSRKEEVHETNYQPSFSEIDFAEYLYNHDNYILLVNQSPFLLLPFCDTLILRRNMLDAFFSQANFLLKMYPDIKANLLIHQIKLSIKDYKGVRAYIQRYEVPTIYYEDYFNIKGTQTPILNTHLHRKTIVDSIEREYHENR